jgi:hypothetical protein
MEETVKKIKKPIVVMGKRKKAVARAIISKAQAG